jgi:hypothetical protein
VFPPPHGLNPLNLRRGQNQRAVLHRLVRAAAAPPRPRSSSAATTGAALVLHTWDQPLRPHFPLHAVLPGGARSFDRTRRRPAHPRYLFPVGAVSQALSTKAKAQFLCTMQYWDQSVSVGIQVKGAEKPTWNACGDTVDYYVPMPGDGSTTGFAAPTD